MYQLFFGIVEGSLAGKNFLKFEFGADQSALGIINYYEFRLWWPYQEAPSQPEGGRFRKVHVIETEVQKDEQDDEGEIFLQIFFELSSFTFSFSFGNNYFLDETMQKTFRDAGMIGGYFRDAKDDLLSEYLVEFLNSYNESAEFQPNKNRKRELKSQLEVSFSLIG